MSSPSRRPESPFALIYLLAAALVSIAGQLLLNDRNLWGLALYGLGILATGLALRVDPALATLPPIAGRSPPAPPARPWYRQPWRVGALNVGLLAALVAFVGASDNTYRWYGVIAWIIAILLTSMAFWTPSGKWWRRLGLGRDGWRWSWTALIVAGLILVGVWFRFWRLSELPPEMNSDHVEKLLDVHDLVTGQRPIFFVRNTGREPWQFYWTLAFIRLFDLETKYNALKLGTAAVSLLTLPGVYLLGKELFGRWVGVWATLFTAVSNWPVLISRIGLRFPFNPAITPWSLLFLLRGLRYGRRNDFILLGLSLGIGLQGYTAFRAMPLAVVVCWGLAGLLSRRRPPGPLIRNAVLTVLIAVIVFVPLGRYSLEHPENFWYRSFSRVSDPDRPYEDSPPVILAKNLWNLALMFHWKGDEVWVSHWRRDAPVLDPVLGALLVLGFVILLWRILRRRDVASLLLLVAGGLLSLPSALSLAFPAENPSVVRTGGAIPVVMMVAALPVGLGMQTAWTRLHGRRRLWVGGVALILATSVVAINRQRIFVDYARQYEYFAINLTEIADAIEGFASSGGDLDDAYIKSWPHWVDTRGVGIELGQVGWDNAMLEIEAADSHVNRPRPRFYVLHPHDAEGLAHLQTLFPHGWMDIYFSRYPGKDFTLYYVPLYPRCPSLEPCSLYPTP